MTDLVSSPSLFSFETMPVKPYINNPDLLMQGWLLSMYAVGVNVSDLSCISWTYGSYFDHTFSEKVK